MIPVIDTHCHIYPDKIARKAATGIGAFYDIGMNFDGRLDTLKAVSSKAHVTHSIIFSVATTPRQVHSINSFIAENVKNSGGRFTGLGAMHPDSEDMEGDVEQILALGLKGVKLHPDIQGVALNDPRLMPLYEACRGKLMVLFHAGDDRYSYSNPAEIIPVLEAFPDVTFIGAHLCGYHVWSEAVPVMSKRFGNLYVDCSSSSFAMGKEKFRAYIEAYGYDRVLFGSDYPMWDPRTESAVLESLDLPQKTLEDIFWNNAARLLNLK